MFINLRAASYTYTGPTTVTAEVEVFHQRLPNYNVTPLIDLPDIAEELGVGHVLLKDESCRFGLPAFKILGASWAIHKAIAARCKLPLTCSLDELGVAAKRERVHLVACTEGNWGRAVARMAKYMSTPANIFVPKHMDQGTQDKISSEGASVVVVSGDYDDSIRAARREAEASNGLLVMDVSWEGYEDIPQWVVEGYSTMLTETDRQLDGMIGKPVTHAIASVGVGSWAQAVVKHYKSDLVRASVIAVEPEKAACLQKSLQSGMIVPIDTSQTIMDGMNCGTVSYTAWDALRQGVDASVTVSDMDVHKDLEHLRSMGIRNGPCGAAPLSALRKLREDDALGVGKGSVVLLFSTEGARDYVVPT